MWMCTSKPWYLETTLKRAERKKDNIDTYVTLAFVLREGGQKRNLQNVECGVHVTLEPYKMQNVVCIWWMGREGGDKSGGGKREGGREG